MCRDRRYSYGRLERTANRLAHFLRHRGVGPDVLVGIGMARGPEQIVAILGILKAGGAYLPLDPEYPDQRLRFMIEDAGVSLVLRLDHLSMNFSPQVEALASRLRRSISAHRVQG